MLSDSTERLGVLRPLSLPPGGRARAAGGGRKQSISSVNTHSPGAGLPLPGVVVCGPHRHFHRGPPTC